MIMRYIGVSMGMDEAISIADASALLQQSQLEIKPACFDGKRWDQAYTVHIMRVAQSSVKRTW